MLKEGDFYDKKENDLNPEFAVELKKVVSEMVEKEIIGTKEEEFLVKKEWVSPILYGLPKIHKTFEKMPKFRPIVSGCGSVMEGTSKFVDHFLKPLTAKSKSYIKDSTHFLKKVKDIKVTESDLIVAADVSSLYTVIDQQEGTDACGIALEARSQEEKVSMPTDCLTRLILMILQSNCFSFNNEFYHQRCGTAMGTTMAPSYANLFMTWVEEGMIEEYKRKTGLAPTHWYRYLDDIIFIWPHGSESLKDFMDFMQGYGELKNLKTKLGFTFEYGKSVPFLDVMVTLADGRINTDLYSKKTDAHLYLRYDSCHPKSCVKGLAKGELLRVRWICSDDDSFKKRSRDMQGYFEKRGFPKQEVQSAVDEVLSMKREDLLDYKTKKTTNRVPCILTYHPRLKRASHILHSNFDLLQSNEHLKEVFESPPMVAFRRLPNIRNQLVKSGRDRDGGDSCLLKNEKCGRRNCKCCKMFSEEEGVDINGKQFYPRKCGSCRTANVIYGLECIKCNKWYIGETKQDLGARMSGHRASVNKVKRGGVLNDDMNDNGTAYHFGEENHDFDRDARVVILECGEWKNTFERQTKEDYYICKFKTLQPTGINVKRGPFTKAFNKLF